MTPTSFTNPWDRVRPLSYFIRFQFTVISGNLCSSPHDLPRHPSRPSRGHGDSGAGNGPALMAKHAEDIARVLDDAGVGRAAMMGVSIGGYALFEFWRRFPGRISLLVLSNTKASPDSTEARAARLLLRRRQSSSMASNRLSKACSETDRQHHSNHASRFGRGSPTHGAKKCRRKTSVRFNRGWRIVRIPFQP